MSQIRLLGMRSFFLLIARVFLLSLIVPGLLVKGRTKEQEQKSVKMLNLFPILMYDSDIGFGFGGKGVLKNYFQHWESFDLTLFASSKGEQWYAFQFSLPDYELRQGTAYPLALDVKIEWDKLLKSNFFGIGNNTPDNDFQFPREFFKIEQILGHAFSPTWIVEGVFRFNHYSVYDYKLNWGTISPDIPGAQENSVSLLGVNLRYDSRDSQIHPHRGMRLMLSAGQALPALGSDWDFTAYRMEWSAYREIFPGHIVALRWWMQQVNGVAPYQELSKVGDSWTARGYKADRFLGKAMTLISIEYRLPIYKSLGGVLFIDSGRVMPALEKLTSADWHSNWGWGLRYYLTNFVVRFDMGISGEGSRIFFNFGHVF